MKKLKHIIPAPVSLFVFLLIGCISSYAQKHHTIGFSQFYTNKDWGNAVTQSMKIEAGFHENLTLKIVDSQGDIDQQIADVYQFIDNKVDAIIISPIAPKPLKAIIEKAKNNNIPVIVLDREIEIYNAFIGVDNFDVGSNAAKYLQAKKKELQIIEIKNWAGTTPTKQKHEGFHYFINQDDKLNVVATVQNSYDNKGIKDKLTKLLNENNNIDYIFAHTDQLALDAFEILKTKNLDQKIKIIGVGGLNSEKGGISLVQQKIIEATILCPTGGKEALKTALQIINNESYDKEIRLPSVVVDTTNVDLLKRQLSLINVQELDIKKQQHRIDQQLKLYKSQTQFLIATLFFLAVIITLLVITYYSKLKLIRQKKLLIKLIDQVDQQKNEIEAIAEDLRIVNEETNNFFTGVSHDFKTPISLILSSSESLIDSEEQKQPIEYSMIYNNSRRLLRMINQLLDFRRVESRRFKLKVSKTPISSFIQNIVNDFKSEASKRDINFSYKSNTETSDIFLDKNLFDNVLFNLLSNAFKFTPNKGTITVKVEEHSKEICIHIKDNGIGIPITEKEKIFQQFYQGSNNKQSSSGIGLYLTKEYVKLHKGNIKVISEENIGTEFIVCIPKGKSHFNSEEIISDDNKNNSIKSNILYNDIPQEHKKGTEKASILIIEDDTDLRTYLKTKLLDQYNIIESNGTDAIEKVLETIPDIIISDVNLPKKSGFEICKIIKNDERTSHIPTLMLTALSSSEAHVKGLQSGVDMFLTKPFNLSVLRQSIESLLYNRKKLQQHYKEALKFTKKTPKKEKKLKANNKEATFISKINSLITKNLDDSTFTVETLAEELNISRVQLYRKTKAILGITISDYIQNFRLEEGKQLLADENLSIADIAYSIGFSSPNYFSTSFKNKFGETPNKFRKKHKNNVTQL